jgi:hypothetical protein
MSIVSPSFNKTLIKNSGSNYTTWTIHENPFGGVNQWNILVSVLVFTPSPYILLQAITSTPIYTMGVSNCSRRIEKFSKKLGTISLRLFKPTFSTMVCELEFKWFAPKLFDRLKCEYEVKTMEEQRVAACSFDHNTLGVEGHARALGWD